MPVPQWVGKCYRLLVGQCNIPQRARSTELCCPLLTQASVNAVYAGPLVQDKGLDERTEKKGAAATIEGSNIAGQDAGEVGSLLAFYCITKKATDAPPNFFFWCEALREALDRLQRPQTHSFGWRIYSLFCNSNKNVSAHLPVQNPCLVG